MIACKKSIALHNRPDKKCAWLKSIDLFLHGKSLDTPLYLVFVIKICPQWVLTIIGLWKIQEFCIYQRMVDFVQNLPSAWIENPLSRNIKYMWDLMICRLFDIFMTFDNFLNILLDWNPSSNNALLNLCYWISCRLVQLTKKRSIHMQNIEYTSTVNLLNIDAVGKK